MANRMLVFSLALNGYQWSYRKHLKTHRLYAKKLGAEYVLVSKPWFTKLGVECCWLKLHLIETALKCGYDQVLFLDADTWVNYHAPDIRQNLTLEKHIYMAKGYTQRYNSGVLLVDNHPLAQHFFASVIQSRTKRLPIPDQVGWGENGHIIYFAKNCNFIAELSQSWNNTHRENIEEFIHHANHGPFRHSIWQRLGHKLLSRTSRLLQKLWCLINKKGQFNKKETTDIPDVWFTDELNRILKIYPAFTDRGSRLVFSQSAFPNCKMLRNLSTNNQGK